MEALVAGVHFLDCCEVLEIWCRSLTDEFHSFSKSHPDETLASSWLTPSIENEKLERELELLTIA